MVTPPTSAATDRTHADVGVTKRELAELLDVPYHRITVTVDGAIALTNAQARRLLVLARKGEGAG